MAGQVFAIASGKGGVGKTTTVVNLGVVLRRADHSVVLVDADLGMANLGPMLGVSGELTLHDVLAGESTVGDALVEEAPGFAVLPGSDSLTDYPDADPKHLGAVLEILAESYDFVLVDTGAGMSHEDVLPLGLVDHVVLVTSPDPAAMGDTRKTAELAGLAGGDIAGLVVTKADAGTDPTHVASQIGVDLLGIIPYDPTVRESTASGRPLEAIDPDTPAATAYRELANALADSSTDPLAEAPAVDSGAEPPATDDRTVDAEEPPEAVSPADSGGSENGGPADTTEATEDPAAAATDEEPSAAETETSPDTADDELLAEGGDVEPDATPDEAEPSVVDSDDEADTDDQAPDVASDDEAESTEEPEVEASEDEEAEPTDEPEVEAPEDEAAEPTEEPEVEASEDEEPGTDETEADEEDYLAEFEDDELESKGGILSRIRRLFR